MKIYGKMKAAKYTVFILNLIVWALGLSLLGFSIFLRVYDVSYNIGQMPESSSVAYFYYALYVLMAAGVLMLLVGFLGCCGAIRESPCMLGFYFFFLIIIVAAEVAAVSFYGMKKDDVENEITRLFEKAVMDFDYQAKNSPGTKELIVEKIQQTLGCCGSDGYSSYAAKGFIPVSCCRDGIAPCNTGNPDLYKRGCVPALRDWFAKHIYIMMGIIVGIVVLQIICMVLSIVLCCHIRREKAFYV